VSKDPKDKAKYDSINAALKDAKPWATIRVLDDGRYVESLVIGDAKLHEGLTLESSKKATIALAPSASIAVYVRGVCHVAVRGFLFQVAKGARQNSYGVAIVGACQGVVIADGEFRAANTSEAIGIGIEDLALPVGGIPNVVRTCIFKGLLAGIRLAGLDNVKERNARPSRGAVVSDNRIFECSAGIWVGGRLKNVHIVGNQFWGCTDDALMLSAVLTGTDDLLVANNTLRGSRRLLTIIEPDTDARGVEIRNNLLLAEDGPDIALDHKDGAIIKAWIVADNWRQGRPPVPLSAEAKGWLLSPKDRWSERIELKSLQPDHVDYLRPPAGSSLGDAGGGQGLPAYIGAVPPEGVAPWDWDRTWRMRTSKPAAGN